MANPTFQPADHLHSRTFIGLLIAQFLAAFNDQAIHAAAMFFAFNTQTLSESSAISLMPILFYAPWAIFCTLAGYLADRFSKRVALVLWKVVEVFVTLLALFGFWLGRQQGYESVGAWIVLSTVFLMGMHSAFFVPAKYGVMAEILTPRMLSRGNGVLESLSFLAVILGTVAGGVLSTLFGRREYLIGVVLFVLALIGAAASFFIERMPAANPNRPFPPYLYGPLYKNIRVLLTSRPLLFAVVGIAFFTFLVAYMRQVVYMHGQSQQPPWSEAYTSYIVGMVALGIGIGSPLAGWLSGGKVEVSLVAFGALGMMLATTIAAIALLNVSILIVCIIVIGFCTGFYLVPLYTLLQHRAPKESKGDAVATSNFINITGAIAASVIFFSLNEAAIRSGYAPVLQPSTADYVGVLDSAPVYHQGHPHRVVVGGKSYESSQKAPICRLLIDRDVTVGSEVVVRTYFVDGVTYYALQPTSEEPNPLYDKKRLPRLLFLGAGALTLVILLVLWSLLPDLFVRVGIWLRTRFRYRLETAGLLRLPGNGGVVVVSDTADPEQLALVRLALDRVTHFQPLTADAIEVTERSRRLLSRGAVVGITLQHDKAVLKELLQAGFPILPVHFCQTAGLKPIPTYVVAGSLLPAASTVEAVEAELQRVAEQLAQRVAGGGALEKEAEVRGERDP
jgi:MFS family permease